MNILFRYFFLISHDFTLAQVLFVLYESASGYALFERVESEGIADQLPQVQASVQDMGKFSKIMKLKAFLPFLSEKNALEEINSISEGEFLHFTAVIFSFWSFLILFSAGVLSDYLKNFLEQHLSKGKDKKSKSQLGISEEKLASAITENLSISCTRGGTCIFML